MIPIDTIVVPKGAEYKAVCRGLKKAGVDRLQVISIPIGTEKIEQTLASYGDQLTQAQNILIAGMCGSLSEQYAVGDIALYENCFSMEGEEVRLPSELTALIRQRLSVDLVACLTSDRLIHQASEKRLLGHTYPCKVVDMEGYGYIKQLQKKKGSLAVLRVVSDDIRRNIPDLSQAINPEGNINAIKMAIAFVQQPLAAFNLIKGSLTGLKVLEQITCQLFSCI